MLRRVGIVVAITALVVLIGTAMGFAITTRGGVRAPVLLRVPPVETTSTTARFAYRARDSGVTLACSLDGRRYRRCGPRRHGYANLRPGRHRFCVVARRGRVRSAPRCHVWTILPKATPGAPSPGARRPFDITGRAIGPLLPGGAPVPVDLVLANPNALPITIEAVTMRVAGSAPAGCADAIAVVRQLASSPTIPGGATRALSDLGVPRATWPHLAMADTGVDQGACAGATIELRFEGRASG